MKNLFVFMFMAAGMLFTTDVAAQIQTPAPSPQAQLSQKVGLTDVTITYSRPSAKDRAVFGELVPYDKVWRTGANAATTVEFSDDVVIMGKELKAGKYSMYSIPGEKKWTIIFNTNSKKWGTTENKEGETLTTVDVTSYKIQPAVESFSISVDDLRNNDAALVISWANTAVKVPFSVPTAQKATASIEKAMAGPSAYEYYAAASYYLSEGQDLKQALDWVNRSIDESNPMYYQVYTRALIFKELGMNEDAVKNATVAKELAEKAGDAHYTRLNTNLLKELGAN